MDIVEFLRARLDEDEAVAREAVERRRQAGMERHAPDYGFQAWEDISLPSVLVGPERVLREVEAKRRIVDGYGGDDCVRDLASVYADHPDYDPEWA